MRPFTGLQNDCYLPDERDNLRVALEHASRPDASNLNASTADLEVGLSISAKLVDYWVASDYREGLRWSTELIQNPASHTFPLARAKALITQGWLLWSMQHFVGGIEQRSEFARQALALAQCMGDDLRQTFALFVLGWDQRDPRRARQQLEEAVMLFRRLGDWRFLAQALGILGLAGLSNGGLESAEEFLMKRTR